MPPKRRPKAKPAVPFVHPAHEQEKAVAADITLEEAINKIAQLEEQIRVMSLQKNQTTNDITLNHTLNATAHCSMSVTDSPRGKKTRRGSSSNLKKDQNGGCSCSGDCGTKRCGCVKKDKICSEFCKCTDLCKNQANRISESNEYDDDDKENEEENVQVPKREIRKKAVKNPITPRERALRNRRLEMLVDEDSSSQDSPVGPPKPKSLFATPGSEAENGERGSSTSETSPEAEEKIINPMKPRHQLPRSPPNKNNDTFNHSARLEVSGRKSRSPSPNVSSTDAVTRSVIKIEQLTPSSHPMQPKHKLARSPVAGPLVADNTQSKSPNLTNNTSVFYDDDVFLPVPKPDSETNSSPPPPEIFKEEVDWDQHKSELVKCRKCQRGFFPYRIEVHEKSCKKI